MQKKALLYPNHVKIIHTGRGTKVGGFHIKSCFVNAIWRCECCLNIYIYVNTFQNWFPVYPIPHFLFQVPIMHNQIKHWCNVNDAKSIIKREKKENEHHSKRIKQYMNKLKTKNIDKYNIHETVRDLSRGHHMDINVNMNININIGVNTWKCIQFHVFFILLFYIKVFRF